MDKLPQSSLFQLTMARFLLFFRQRESLFWTFAFPILFSIGLSIAFRNRPPEVLPVGATTKHITQVFNADNQLKAITLEEGEGRNALATGRILVLTIQRQNGIQFDYDDTNPDARVAQMIAEHAIQRAAGQQEAVATQVEVVRRAGSRYIDFVVPGLLGINLMSSGLWAVGFSITEARQKKLLKRLVASPMPRRHYLASFLLSRLLLVGIEAGIFLGFAHIAFGIPFKGPLWQLGLLCTLASLTFSAFGLLVASRAQTIEAASGLSNLTVMPMWMLSGVFFSASRFPDFAQPFIHILPLTAAIDAFRGNMIEGIQLTHLLFPVTVLLIWLSVTFTVSLRIFRWR
jgi:ABC-2 type transport system permease protein